MASETSSNIQREASLRRIAIVLSSLPPATAAQIMGTIDPESKRTVRRTMASLADVDPLERKRAIHAFKVSLKRNPASAGSGAVGDEVMIRSGSRRDDNVGAASSRVLSSSELPNQEQVYESSIAHSSLAFLADVNDDTLVRVLSSEHPQAVAMVLASMNPSHAARVLPRLEAGLQTETLSRIGRLGNVSQEAVGEVAEHLKQRVNDSGTNSSDPAGKRALDAILAELPSSSRAAMEHPGSMDANARHTVTSSDPAVDLTRKLRDAELDTPSTQNEANLQEAISGTPEGAPLRLVDADGNTSNVDPALTQTQDEAQSSSGDAVHDHLRSTDSINAFLLSLEPVELCRGLGNVDTRTAMLALCGLPMETSNAVLAVLPKATARKVRLKMTTLGSLNLRDIDEAKEVIAKALLVESGSTTSNERVPMAA